MKKKPTISRSTQTDEEPLDLNCSNQSLASRQVPAHPNNLLCLYCQCNCTCHKIPTGYIRSRLPSLPSHLSHLPRAKKTDKNASDVFEDYTHGSSDKEIITTSNKSRQHIFSEGSSHLFSCMNRKILSKNCFDNDQNKNYKVNSNNDTHLNSIMPENELNENNSNLVNDYAYKDGHKETTGFSDKIHKYEFSEESNSISTCMNKLSLSKNGVDRERNKNLGGDTNDPSPKIAIIPESEYNESNSNIPVGWEYGEDFKETTSILDKTYTSGFTEDESSCKSTYKDKLSLSEYEVCQEQNKMLRRDTNNDKTLLSLDVPEKIVLDKKNSDMPEGYADNDIDAQILREACRESFFKRDILTCLRKSYRIEEVLENSIDDLSIVELIEYVKRFCKINAAKDSTTVKRKDGKHKILDTTKIKKEPSNMPKCMDESSVSVSEFDDQTVQQNDNHFIGVETLSSREMTMSSRVTAPEVKENREESKNRYKNLQYSSKPYINDIVLSIINENLESLNSISDEENPRNSSGGVKQSYSNASNEEKSFYNYICQYSLAFVKYIFEALKTSADISNKRIEPTKKQKEEMKSDIKTSRLGKIKEMSKYEFYYVDPNEAFKSAITDFLSERLIFLEILLESLTWLEDYYYEVMFFRKEFLSDGKKERCRNLSKTFNYFYNKLEVANMFLVQLIKSFKTYSYVMKVDIEKCPSFFTSLLVLFQGLVERSKKVKDFKNLKSLESGDYNFLFMVMNFPKYSELSMEILKKEIIMYKDFIHKQGWSET